MLLSFAIIKVRNISPTLFRKISDTLLTEGWVYWVFVVKWMLYVFISGSN